MKHLSMTLCGTRPLLQHNTRLVDPLDEWTQRLSAATTEAKSSKTDEAHLAMALVEFEGGLYHDPEIGPYVKAEAVEACLRKAAATGFRGAGEKVKRGVLVSADDGGDAIPLLYTGPRDVAGLKADPNYRLRAAVKVGQNRVMRTRPRFPAGWRLECSVALDESQINPKQFEAIAVYAGEFIGLGDHRPRYGRFGAKLA